MAALQFSGEIMTKYAPYTTGQEIGPFKVTHSQTVEELNCLLTELTHQSSGAKVIHIGNDDPENTFCLSFKTIPETSNGIAHILEHTVLCGSENFPVSDPFFSMHRRSLATFMNAFTGADFTCYPASSQIKTDFFNLFKVYIDAVFHPLLTQSSFLQEGWRHEFLVPNDSKTPLAYKGIVYNEMKGALSSNTTRLIECLNKAMFPDITYGVNSGGDPKNIPELTYEGLKEFHKTFYHPSRCLFYLYGDIPLEENLEFLDEEILGKAEQAPPIQPVPLQKRFSEPVTVTSKYPVSADEELDRKTMVGLGWLTCQISEQEEILALSVIDIILLSTDAAPLKKALLQSGLCTEVSPYLDSDISEIPFVIILKGCQADAAPKIKQVIKEALEKILKEGFTQEKVESAIHQLELHRSEIIGEGTPFGLSLFLRSCLAVQHGAPVLDGLIIHEQFAKLRKNISENPRYLEELAEKFLISNPHFVTVVMEPSPTLEQEELEEERKRLNLKQEKLTAEESERIIQESQALADYQEQQQHANLDVLPKLELSDIPKENHIYSLSHEKMGHLDVFHHDCFTNGITYAEIAFPLANVQEEDLPYLRLFSSLLPQVGCGGRDYSDHLDYVLAHTGGVDASLHLNIQAHDNTQFIPTMHIRGKSLYRKAEYLFTLLQDMISSADFTDSKRIQSILAKSFTRMESSLNSNALKYATSAATSEFSQAAKINYYWSGLPYYWLIRDLSTQFQTKRSEIIEKLTTLKDQLLGLSDAHLIIGCDSDFYKELKSRSFYGVEKLPAKSYEQWKTKLHLNATPREGRVISSQVAFTSSALPTVSYIDPDSPALLVASMLFDNLVLHTRIREQGGAYGGGSSLSPVSGNFLFYAYRDPNIASTIKAFEDAVHRISEGDFGLEKLEEAKLETIQGMDSPISPGSRASLAYSWLCEGRNDAMRQKYRNRVLSLTKEEVVEAVNKHLKPKIQEASTAIYAGKALLESEIEKLKGMGVINSPTVLPIFTKS